MFLSRQTSYRAYLILVAAALYGCDVQPKTSATTADAALPLPITVAERITSNSGDNVCSHGGIRVVYGIDHDGNGRVGPYESIGMEYLCSPSNTGESGPRIVLGPGIPKADLDAALEALNRS